MTVTLIPTRFWQARCTSLLKRWRVPRQQQKHIKQVARDPQLVQVNLLWHQHTEIPPSKSNKKNRTFKFRQEANKFGWIQAKKATRKIREDLTLTAQSQTDVTEVVTPSTEKGLDVQQASTSVKFVINLVTSVVCVIRREMVAWSQKVLGLSQGTPIEDWYSLYKRFFEQPVRRLLKWKRFMLLVVTGAIYSSWDQLYSTTASSHKFGNKVETS